MKSLESLVAVHTHTHTHTICLSNIIARNCKTFYVPKNIKNLEYNY